jgi:hypothetical protein
MAASDTEKMILIERLDRALEAKNEIVHFEIVDNP